MLNSLPFILALFSTVIGIIALFVTTRARKVQLSVSIDRGEWVSIDNRLPDEHVFVLACSNEGVDVVAYEYGKFQRPECMINCEDITHWMDLPQTISHS